MLHRHRRERRRALLLNTDYKTWDSRTKQPSIRRVVGVAWHAAWAAAFRSEAII